MFEPNDISVQNDLCSNGAGSDYLVAFKTMGLLHGIGRTITSSYFHALDSAQRNTINSFLCEEARVLFCKFGDINTWKAVELVAQKLLVEPKKKLTGKNLNIVMKTVRKLLDLTKK